MDDPLRLIIVRHGETHENIRQVIQGHKPGRLSGKGRSQIRRVALRLRKEHIDVILSSDLRRAAITAREIGKFHDAPIIHCKELRERKMGVYEGKHKSLVDRHRIGLGLHETEFRPDGGESYEDVRRRVSKFLDKIYKKYRNKTVLIATHGVVIRCILSVYTKIPLKKSSRLMIRNTGVLILEVNGRKVKEIEEDLFL